MAWLRVYSQEGVATTSGGRYKESVAALPYGLDEVNALRPVAFSWVDGPADEIHYGLIAQQVRKVLPDVVSGGASPDGTLGLDYDELEPVLIKAVQEQQEQIDAQAEQLTAVEARLTAIEEDRPTRQTVLNPFSAIGFGGLALGVAIVAGRRRTGGRP